MLYALGTVVRVKGYIGEYMIMGYYPMINGKVHRYMLINAAFGVSSGKQNLMIDDDAIDEVLFEGYSDEEGLELRECLYEMMSSEETE